MPNGGFAACGASAWSGTVAISSGCCQPTSTTTTVPAVTVGLRVGIRRVFVDGDAVLGALDLHQPVLDLKRGAAAREPSTETNASLVPWTMSVGATISSIHLVGLDPGHLVEHGAAVLRGR
jgi:hypothetical protein